MKENREELKRNLTASNLFHVNLEQEGNQIKNKIPMFGPVEDQPKKQAYKKLDGNMKFNFINESVLNGHLDNILLDNEGKHSEEWKVLVEAVTAAKEVFSDKERLNSDEGVLKLMALSEACNRYYETHIKKSGKKADMRKMHVRAIRNMLSTGFAGAAGIGADEELVPVDRLKDREAGASENVKRLSEYYVAFSKKIGEDKIGSVVEKLNRRWNVLKSCEEDIRIYRQTHEVDQKSDPEIWHVIKEYDHIRSQIFFLKKLKKAGGHEAVFENRIADELLQKTYETEDKPLPPDSLVSKEKSDEGLSDKQLAGLSEIDTWVVRNFSNGGYMACFGETTDRSDIINNLLSLSRRERMYIYYLVEKHERINPTIEGFGMSQTDYVPDIKAFKNHMVANKLKFYSRFSGGYIYWNKLSQAMAIAMRTRPMLQTVMKNTGGLSKDKKADGKGKLLSNTQKEQKKHLKNLYKLLKDSKDILEKLGREKKAAGKKELKDQLEVLRALAGEELAALQRLDNSIEKKNLNEIRESVEGAGVQKKPKQPDVKQYLSGMPSDIAGVSLKTSNMIKEHVLGFSDKTVDSILKVMNPVNTGLGALTGAIGFVFSAMAMIEGGGNMSWNELAENAAGLGVSAVTTASKGAGVVKLFTGKDSLLTGKELSSALIVADLGIQAFHTATMTRDEYHRMKATQKFSKVLKAKKKAGESAEFEKNMMLLQDRISNSRAKTTFTKLALSGAMIVTLFVCPPVGAAIAAGQFAGAIGNRVWENRRKRSNKYYLFDNHFKIEEKANALIQKKYVKEPVDKEALMSQLRRRVAASIGYASPSDAADALSKRYAKKMIELANAGGENSDYYIQLIKGFGLYYRYIGPNSTKNRPSVNDLAKKLTI